MNSLRPLFHIIKEGLGTGVRIEPRAGHADQRQPGEIVLCYRSRGQILSLAIAAQTEEIQGQALRFAIDQARSKT